MTISSSCGIEQSNYDKIINTPDNEQSKISLKIIENITKVFSNFAKYG